ncbi:YveK family protein [Clostridium tarantellae]|uniref:Capsular biosynthesis protein n=1 Tax=Clostridium tarantellae TaxID=39493 RepID=A0A6I1MKK1_9CLOT|nr:Wzz/FepE/Etk N-terminal domain-containing protein [Clostridium tarantellae]MPQ43504.1 capsular biosynthesis protein [Clostridium tarantellae]
MSESIEFSDLIQMVKKRWKLITIITLLITTLFVSVTAFLIKPQYESSVKLFIGKEEAEGKNYNNSDVAMYQNLIKTYAEIIKTKDLISNAINLTNININTKTVLNNLIVTPRLDTQILEVKLRGNNKEQTVEILNSVVNEFIYRSNNLIKNGNIQIIQSVEIPESPVSPKISRNLIISFILGLIIALMISFLIEYLDNTFKVSEDIEKHFHIAVIGVIPKESISEKSNSIRKRD